MEREAEGDSFSVLFRWNRFKVVVIVACVASGGTVLLSLFLILEPLGSILGSLLLLCFLLRPVVPF
jgi:hypothetical protein